MSKKTLKKQQPAKNIAAVVPPAFGYEEMLAELEAIVVDAGVKQTDRPVPDETALSRD